MHIVVLSTSYPWPIGAHVFLLGKIPSPKIVTMAFLDVRPNLVITVPLILEKIYREIIMPRLQATGNQGPFASSLLPSALSARPFGTNDSGNGGQFL